MCAIRLGTLCFFPRRAEAKGTVGDERVHTGDAAILAHVRNFSVLSLLARSTNFDGNNTAVLPGEGIRDKKGIATDRLKLDISKGSTIPRLGRENILDPHRIRKNLVALQCVTPVPLWGRRLLLIR